MDNHYKESIRFQLMDEISNINTRVEALGKPRITAERSLIARYGKLLFLSQQLLDSMTRMQLDEKSSTQKSTLSGEVIPATRSGGFSRRFGLV